MRWMIIGLALTLASCVSVDTTNRSRVDLQTRDVVESSVALGDTLTAGVGDAMVRVRNYSEETRSVDVMVPSEGFRISGFSDGDVSYTKDKKFVIVGERQINDQTFTLINLPEWGVSAQVAPDGSITPALVNVDIEMVWRATVTPATVRLKRDVWRTVITKPSGANYDFVYAGTDGQSLRFQYREFAGTTLLTPTLSQDVVFPSGSSSIQFRSMKIDIVSATPTGVTFIVRRALDVESGPTVIVPAPPPPKASNAT